MILSQNLQKKLTNFTRFIHQKMMANKFDTLDLVRIFFYQLILPLLNFLIKKIYQSEIFKKIHNTIYDK